MGLLTGHVRNCKLASGIRMDDDFITANISIDWEYEMIETERLRLYPASQEQMEMMISCEMDGDLKQAYREMLEGCLHHPDQWEWFAMWMIELKDGTHIGDLCFKGLDSAGVSEIGYGLLEQYRKRGYATEAVKAVIEWAFQNPNVTTIEAESEPGNLASQKVLAKCGFIPNGMIGREGLRYRLSR